MSFFHAPLVEGNGTSYAHSKLMSTTSWYIKRLSTLKWRQLISCLSWDKTIRSIHVYVDAIWIHKGRSINCSIFPTFECLATVWLNFSLTAVFWRFSHVCASNFVVYAQHFNREINFLFKGAVDMATLTLLQITFSGQNECESFVHVCTLTFSVCIRSTSM